MRAMFTGIMLLAASGCGLDETVFIPDYADAYCQKAISCLDPAVAAFDGMATQEACLSVVGPEIEAEVAACKYRGGKAKKCLNAMENMSCPPEDIAFDDYLPIECDIVLIACGAVEDQSSSTTTETTTGTTTEESGA